MTFSNSNCNLLKALLRKWVISTEGRTGCDCLSWQIGTLLNGPPQGRPQAGYSAGHSLPSQLPGVLWTLSSLTELVRDKSRMIPKPFVRSNYFSFPWKFESTLPSPHSKSQHLQGRREGREKMDSSNGPRASLAQSRFWELPVPPTLGSSHCKKLSPTPGPRVRCVHWRLQDLEKKPNNNSS